MFKDNLKKLRINKQISQKALADKIFVSRSAVAKWEQGRGMPNEESIKLLCEYFEVTEKELMENHCNENSVNNITIVKEKNKYTFGTLILLFMILIPCFVMLYSVYKDKNDGWYASHLGFYGSADIIGIEINKEYEISFDKIVAPTPIKYDEVIVYPSDDNSYNINGNVITFLKPGRHIISSEYIDNIGKNIYYVTIMVAYCYDPELLIEIKNYDDLKNINNNLSASYILSSSIDLSEVNDFTPIGINDGFTGVFLNPNKYVISNLSIGINNSMSNEGGKIGGASFFWNVTNGYVDGLILDDVKIDISNTPNYLYDFTGGLSGYVSDSLVTNCTINGTVIGKNNVGGIIGYCSFSTVRNCVFNGYVKEMNSAVSKEVSAGGLIGYSYRNNVYNNFVVGNIESSNIAGGLCGYIKSTSYYNNNITCDLIAPFTYKIGRTDYDE